MLPKTLRLSKAKVLPVIRYGEKSIALDAALYFLKDNSTKGAKWHVQIPKRIVPKASHRNRLRRVFHEAIRLAKLPNNNGEAVLKITKLIPKPTFEKAKESLEELLNKNAKIKDKNDNVKL